MRYYPKLNQYKCSNLVYDVESETAYSYEWYVIAKRINGVMVINSYSYSNTTTKHYYKIRDLLKAIRIGNDFHVFIEAPKGLQDLDAAIELYQSYIANLEAAINKPRSKKSKNIERKIEIDRCQKTIMFIKTFLKKEEV